MRPIRVLVAAAAAVLLAAGCGGGSTSGSGSPAGAGSPAASGSPRPSGSGAAGQGIAALPAEQILARATTALQEAESVRLKGQGGSGGQQFSLDLRYRGQDSAGTVGSNGQTVELRKLGQTVYLKGGREFWTGTGGAAAAQLLAGKWLRTPLTDRRFSGLSQLTDLRQAAKSILAPDTAITKGTEKTVNGTPAIGLVSGGKEPGVLWVATTGEPYPLRIEPADGSGQQGALDFTGYGEQVATAAPPADQVVDVSRLPGN